MPKLLSPLFTLKLQSFRAFRDEAAIDLKPLTLLYGFNQAGKSTLLRFLVLLADSLQPGAGPLDLKSPSLRGATFKELGWLGRDPTFTPRLTVVVPQTQGEPTLRIHFDNVNGLVVNRLHLVHGAGGDKFKVDLDGPPARRGSQVSATYTGTYRGQDWSGSLEFGNLLPGNLPEEAEAIGGEVRTALRPLERLQWLHANRLAGEETKATRCCRPDGADLPALLHGSPGPSVLEIASAWLRDQEGLGNEIALRQDSSGRSELVHGAAGRERLPLHLAGEGIRALLPILLCTLWAETRVPGAPTMLAVEEPEAHLHPTLQVALFNRLVEGVHAGIPVVLETHSVYLLRAMQLAILERQLSPEHVGLYWVGQNPDGSSTVTTVGIEADATLQDWRPDVFEKEQELAHRILDLRWQQERDG
jgi:hypothetical protein